MQILLNFFKSEIGSCITSFKVLCASMAALTVPYVSICCLRFWDPSLFFSRGALSALISTRSGTFSTSRLLRRRTTLLLLCYWWESCLFSDNLNHFGRSAKRGISRKKLCCAFLPDTNTSWNLISRFSLHKSRFARLTWSRFTIFAGIRLLSIDLLACFHCRLFLSFNIFTILFSHFLLSLGLRTHLTFFFFIYLEVKITQLIL